MVELITLYFVLAAIPSALVVLDFYQKHFKERSFLWGEELTFYEFITLVILGAIFGGLIFPFILIRGMFEIIRGIKNATKI